MSSYNKVMLMGNLTRDPELRYTPNGSAIANLSVAVNRKWKTESGEEKEETGFFEVDAFGRQAEVIGQYFSKGKPIFVEGRLRFQTWDDKETGKKRSKVSVLCDKFVFVGGRDAAQDGSAKPAIATTPKSPIDDEDCDVPF